MYHKKEVTGIHYALPGHTRWNFSVQIIEKVTPNTPREREEHWIKNYPQKLLMA
jgi:hypothetical protein